MTGVFSGEMDISPVSLPDNVSYHLCGPILFTHAIHDELTKHGVPPKDIQYEVFGPVVWHEGYDQPRCFSGAEPLTWVLGAAA